MRFRGLIDPGFSTSSERALVHPHLRLKPELYEGLGILKRCFAFVAVLLFLPASTAFQEIRAAQSRSDEGIRIDLPSNGQVRIENRFGDIRIIVAKENAVLVAATIAGEMSANQSPVVIERKNDLLLISVIPERKDNQVRVNLTVRIPDRARAEIVTAQGSITSLGLAASLSLNTISGNIVAEVQLPLDADIIARSVEGRVRSGIGNDDASDTHNFRSRFGAGKKILRANSQQGEIALRSLAESDQAGNASETPRLRGSTQSPATGIPATQSASQDVEDGDVIRVDTELVNMNFSVVDRGTNRGVAGLSATDFKLFEDGSEQNILHFDSSAAPFDLVLVIDLSGSTREMVKLIRAAARRFVDAARPSDRIAIITFAAKPSIVSALTLDREILRQRVEAIETLRGDTKLYDALDFVLKEAVSETRSARRTALVIMSDGLDGSIPGVNSSNVPDPGSQLPYKELVNKLGEFDGVVYGLWLNTYYEALNPQDTQPEAFDLGHDRMKELAEAGGGVLYEVDKLADLAGAYERVVADLGTVYSLAYRPVNKNRDGKWRSIRLVVDRTSAVARGKHGYYAN
jgi:VWFA-related protein